MGRLVRRTLGGDATIATWSPHDAASVDAAAQAMRREVDAGYVAVLEGEGRIEPVDELPADADLVVLSMPLGGGGEPAAASADSPAHLLRPVPAERLDGGAEAGV